MPWPDVNLPHGWHLNPIGFWFRQCGPQAAAAGGDPALSCSTPSRHLSRPSVRGGFAELGHMIHHQARQAPLVVLRGCPPPGAPRALADSPPPSLGQEEDQEAYIAAITEATRRAIEESELEELARCPCLSQTLA